MRAHFKNDWKTHLLIFILNYWQRVFIDTGAIVIKDIPAYSIAPEHFAKM